MVKRKKKLLLILLCLCLAGIVTIFGIDAHVKKLGGERIISPDKAAELEDVDCILVLGCFVKNDGTPSDMLADRLRRGVELYELGASDKLLMSGDHGRQEYDEVSVMKQYAVDAGIVSSDVFMDHAGFSTYESVYRAKEIFEALREQDIYVRFWNKERINNCLRITIGTDEEMDTMIGFLKTYLKDR